MNKTPILDEPRDPPPTGPLATPRQGHARARHLRLAGTPEDCLWQIQRAFPDHIVVLESAFASAKRARSFRNTKKLMRLLRLLADDYYRAISSGIGDGRASKVLGPAYAAKESSRTADSPRARVARTFSYDGRQITMWAHLRIGAIDSVAETIRVHFAWIASERKIVIGWCGEHRYIVR